MEVITIRDTTIRLGQFLKLATAVSTGGEAKIRIQNGEVQVNSQVELRRGAQLKSGDVVEIDNQSYLVQ